MNRTVLKTVGTWAGYLIVPLFIASAISLLTFRQFSPLVIAALIVLVVCILLFTLANPQAVGQFFGGRAVRNSVTTLIIVLSVIGIVVLVNVLATRVTVRLDTTKNQLNTLNDSSVKIAQKLQDQVKVTIFYTQQSSVGQRDQAVDLLNRYKAYSDKIVVDSLDIQSLAGVTKARELDIKTEPLAVFQQGNKREDATVLDEQTFTRTLQKLQQTVQKRVFFVTGHGERGTQGMSQAAKALTDNNYKVDSLNLTTNTGADGKAVQLSPATDILIFSGPTAPMSAAEVQNVTVFLRQGGRGMFMYDPTNVVSTKTKDNLNDVLKDWSGLGFQTGWVLETDPQVSSPNSPIILLPDPSKSSSDIVRGINYQITYPLTAGIDQGTNTSGVTPLFSSSTNSWIKTDPQEISQQKFNFVPGKDKQGPVVIAASFEAAAKDAAPGATAPATANKTRLVLFGGVEFAADNQSLGFSLQFGNYNLFVNSVNWLAEASDAVVIQPKQPDNVPLTINEAQQTFVYYSTVFGLPILVFVVGLAIWWRRR